MGRHPAGCRTGAVEGYRRETYGEAFADVYDDWYTGITDAEQTADVVAELAGAGGRVLELAVGTGRLALPIAAPRPDRRRRRRRAPPMLDRLRARDAGRHRSPSSLGDMVDDLPAGPFDVALIAYNSLFNLESAERQRPASRPSPPASCPAAGSSSRRSCPTTARVPSWRCAR